MKNLAIKEKLADKTIAVLYGGWSAERDISLLSGQAVIKALREEGLRVVPIDVGQDIFFRLKEVKPDIAFIALHGPFGEDGKIQALLELLDIPYTGSGVLASALAMDKIFTKKIFEQAKLPTPRWQAIAQEPQTAKRKFPFPCVVKPATQGSALGVSIVEKEQDFLAAVAKAFQLSAEVLVEEYIAGRELTISILDDKALPILEIFPANQFYDFQAKYEKGKSNHSPAKLPKKLALYLQQLGLAAHKALGCKAVSRIDLILDKEDSPFLLEVNTIPGMTSTSLLPDAAKAAGISFNHLLLKIIECVQ